MQTQTKFSMDLYGAGLRSMNDVLKTSLDYSARLQGQQLQMMNRMLSDMMAMQMRLAMEFWSNAWRAALTPPGGRGARGGPSPT